MSEINESLDPIFAMITRPAKNWDRIKAVATRTQEEYDRSGLKQIFDSLPPENISLRDESLKRLRRAAPELLELCLWYYSSSYGHKQASEKFAALLGWLQTGKINE